MGIRLLRKTGRISTPGLNQAVGTVDDADKEAPAGTAPIQTTSQQVYGGSSGAVKPVTPQPAQQTKGSGFTNIQKILKASSAESGAGRLAQKAASGVRQATKGTQEAVSGAVGKFGEGIATAGEDLGKRESAITPILTSAISGSSVTPEQETVWRGITGGQTTAPTGLSLTPEQQRQAAQTSALSKLAGDVSGRSALLQKYVGSPQYGESKQRLDALLLGRGGASQIRSALREGARAEQELKRQDIVAQEQAKQLQQRATGIAEEAKTKLSDAERRVLETLKGKKTTFIEGLDEVRNRVISVLSRGGTVNKSDLDLLGIKPEDIFIPYGTGEMAASDPNSRAGINQSNLISAPGIPSTPSSAIGSNKVFLGNLTDKELDFLRFIPGAWDFRNPDGSPKRDNSVSQETQDLFRSIKTYDDMRKFIQTASPELVALYTRSGLSTTPQNIAYDFSTFLPSEEELTGYYQTLGDVQYATPAEAAQLTALGRLSGAQYGDLGQAYTTTSTSPIFDASAYRTYIQQQNQAFIESDPIYLQAQNMYNRWGTDEAKKLAEKRRNELIDYLQQNALKIGVS